MTSKRTGKPNGRPKILVSPPIDPQAPPEQWKGKVPEKVINLEQVLYWMELQATEEEIAGAFRVDPKTLDARLKESFGLGFSELKKRTSGKMKIAVRRYQFQQAEKNATMAIWLGKIWLGQKEEIIGPALAPNQTDMDKDHTIMELKNELAEVKERLNANKP